MLKPEKALQILKEGNERFAHGKSIHPNREKELREALVSDQNPFAVVISCSDSRVPVEIIFDAGLGDLFIIRTAGHVLSKETLGSLEYAVKKLKVKLVVILGHENCGAVKTALAAYKTKKYDELSENLKALLNHIYPVFETLDTKKHDAFEKALYSNVRYQISDLMSKDPYIAQMTQSGKLGVVGAMYSLEKGTVEFLED